MQVLVIPSTKKHVNEPQYVLREWETSYGVSLTLNLTAPATLRITVSSKQNDTVTLVKDFGYVSYPTGDSTLTVGNIIGRVGVNLQFLDVQTFNSSFIEGTINASNRLDGYKSTYELNNSYATVYLNANEEPGSSSNPFETTTSLYTWATANLGTLRSGVSSAWVGKIEYTWEGPDADMWYPTVKPPQQTQSPVGEISRSLLAGAPLDVTDDSGISASLGPTSQAASTAELAALKVQAITTSFTDGTNLLNSAKWPGYGYFSRRVYGSVVQQRSAPWPQTNGTIDWWARGGYRLHIEGIGSISFVYTLNTTNSCKILVDGKRLSTSDTSGLISNAVTSGSNAYQWVTVTTTTDKRRCITINTNGFGIREIIYSPGITITKVDYVGKAIVFGDSFASRFIGAGETALIASNLAATALELLGYDVTDAASGSTGFLNNGGGFASNKGSYSDYIDQYISDGTAIGFDPLVYSAIWLFGTGNDFGAGYSAAAYLNVIRKAADTFKNARICISSVYEGFNSDANALSMNTALKAAVDTAISEYGFRILWVPVDTVYKWDGYGIWAGSGSVPAPAYNGNADVYFSNVTQGASDRHPNNKGVVHGAKYYAIELIRAGLPYKKPA